MDSPQGLGRAAASGIHGLLQNQVGGLFNLRLQPGGHRLFEIYALKIVRGDFDHALGAPDGQGRIEAALNAVGL